MALGSHCSCVVPEKRERSPGSWGLERAPAGAPRGRWRSTEIIDLFLLESCAVDATQGSLRSGRPAMGAFLASKPNPQYRATERAHGRGPGAGVCVCVGGTTVPAAAEITARLAPLLSANISNHIFLLLLLLLLLSIRAPGGHVKTKGTIYLSNIRMVFVASKPVGNFFAFDMPLLFVHGEKFNQPIFHCNNISGFVEPVVPDNQNRALYSTHTFKILFKEGGCGTFVPLFLNLTASVRRYNEFEAQSAANMAPRVDPLQAAQTPVDDMMHHAYVDPNDPTKIYLQQPAPESQLRRRNYHRPADAN
ncbi:uncharacterized protein [Zea mays]|uniref:uncharacterized protein n=1 Tax=Zea mays TaxID=4577 RepID=UPI0004DE9339|nr:uncharacterized protein LOC103645155 [Zea mays]|eukprot:XP_008666489.1 uncharacterized protein LOC103645155 [Zea mays]